jgi:hypothetical protein
MFMSDPVHISETRHGRMLAEGAGLLLTLAREAQERAMAAEDGAAFDRHAATCNRTLRGMRQCLALEAKLGREQEAHDLQAAPLREKDRKARVSRRHTQVYRAIEPLIWTEHEDIASELVADLREMLDFEALDDDFLREPLARQIDRIRGHFDLIGPDPGPDDDVPQVEADPADVEAYDASDQSWAARIGHPADRDFKDTG